MAVTKEEVNAAASALTEKNGKPPTVIEVRAFLKNKGSYTTITPLLRAWKDTQAPPTVAANPTEPAPQVVIDSLVAVAPKIWGIAADLANEHLTSERSAMDIERSELQSALSECMATEEVIAAELETAQAQIDALTATISSLETNHAAILHEHATARLAAEQAAAVLQGTNHQMQTRICDLQTLNDELKATIVTINADLTVANSTIARLTVENSAALQDLTAARASAERAAAVFEAKSDQQEIRLAEQQDHIGNLTSTISDLKSEHSDYKAQIAALEADRTHQIAAIHMAQTKAASAEATAAAQTSQINDLQETVKQLRDDLVIMRAAEVNSTVTA